MEAKSRRNFVKQAVMASAAAFILPSGIKAYGRNNVVEADYSLVELPYAFDALEPHIDKQTMEVHYTKHYNGYVKKLNDGIAKSGLAAPKGDVGELCKQISSYSEHIKNNAGGAYNHGLFWQVMIPGGKKVNPDSKLMTSIESQLNGVENLQEKFNTAAATQFGSGWAWLIVDKNKKLQITASANQDNPLMDTSKTKGAPILALDVWEHAYYLKYQNRRKEYIAAWWNTVNWEKVEELYLQAIA